MSDIKSPHLDAAWLRRKYIDEQLSTYAIGALVKRDPKRVYEKLREFGIPTRPRGLNLKGNDNFMRMHPGANPFAGRAHSDETRRVLSRKASIPKPHLCGARNGMSGRTGVLNPNYKTGSSPERQRIYSSGEAKAFVRAIFVRDGYRCRRCGAGKSGPRGLHAHHIACWAENPKLRFEAANVVTLCRPCHEWIHSAENVERVLLG